MAKDKISMPSSMGGLVRYFDEYKSRISLKPGTVIVLSVVIIIVMIIIHVYGKSFLGF
jgi:preprotein translocase subunit Sec61beta